jgi:hypothetical protein
MKIAIAIGLLACSLFASSARAALVCLVADPTGTPLNVRSQPNGTILGALHNDAEVIVTDMTNDRRWVKVISVKAGRPGWVFFNYLDCEM